MIVCPDCGFGNIDGADVCEACLQPLVAASAPAPTTDLEASILHDRIDMLVSGEPLSVQSRTRVSDVLEHMVEQSVGCVVVFDGDDMVGIFTEHDALMRLNTGAAQFSDRPISEFMTPNPESLEVHDKIAFALQRMDAGRYRHIPVLSDGRLCGLLSVRDVLRYITENAIDEAD